MSTPRKLYPSEVTDEEWAFVAPYLSLMSLVAPQRRHDLREGCNALRWLVRTGSPWRYLPNAPALRLPPWPVVFQQTQRWLAAGCFEAIADDPRALLHLAAGRGAEPTAVILDGRTLRSSPESGNRARSDGHTRTKGTKRHAAVDTLGDLLAAGGTPANDQERGQVEALVQEVQGGMAGIAPRDENPSRSPSRGASDHDPADPTLLVPPPAERSLLHDLHHPGVDRR